MVNTTASPSIQKQLALQRKYREKLRARKFFAKAKAKAKMRKPQTKEKDNGNGSEEI